MLLIFYFICLLFPPVLTLHEIPDPGAWSTIEALAEKYPYIAAILNHEKEYVCTGVVIDKRAVLSSGACVTPEPYYVAVGSAVFHTHLNNISLFQVAYAKPHNDFLFEIHENGLNISRMHSNIGIVFTVVPILEHFFERAVLSNYYAPELKEKQLVMVGFGNVTGSQGVVLQQQFYHQMACKNPKWYYCVCGIEYSAMTYEEPFGEGGPVLYDNEIVGVAACASGSLTSKPNINYNIFTVIGPYLSWIEKTKSDSIVEFIAEAIRNKDICKISIFLRNMNMKTKWEPLRKVGIVGVPFEKGQKKYGVSVAPAALRSAGLIDRLKEIDGLDVKDYGDIEISSSELPVDVDNMTDLPLVSACNRNLSKKVTQVIKDDRIAVTIGGDHSIGVGTVDGHFNVNEDMILIWVDAHADINTNKTSESGSVHGMPVALLVKELSDYWPYLPTMDWQVPKFSIKNLGYIGLRSVDKYERLAIEKYKVPAFAMEDIEDFGIHKSINHVLETLDPEGNKPIHVSFDIDSLDSLEAPSTGTAVRGGLTLREAIKLMEIIHATGRLRAIDLVEINPALGNDSDRKRTIEAGLSVLTAALGFSRRGMTPRGVSDLPVQTYHNIK